MKLIDITKGSEHDLSLFSEEKITELESRIVVKEGKKAPVPSLTCLCRKQEIKLTPEEVVRQLYLLVLTEDFGYPLSRIKLEYEVTFGREKKRADIVIFDKQQTDSPYIIT